MEEEGGVLWLGRQSIMLYFKMQKHSRLTLGMR